MPTAVIEVEPISGALGAEIGGVDLSQALGEDVFARVHAALLEHGVIFFRGQQLTPAAQIDFARHFGELDVHPIVNSMEGYPEVVRAWKPVGESASFGTGWHSDNSFFACPSLATVLYGVTVPPHGGDTLFASMEKAYEALSRPMRDWLDGMQAVHSAAIAYDPKTTGKEKYEGDAAISYRFSETIYEEVEHPIVRRHPDTGRPSLFVNQMFTQRIVGLNANESEAVLSLLYDHCTQPDFTCRFRWQQGSVAFWDNRSVQHYALDDYREFERLMLRVTIQGDRPR